MMHTPVRAGESGERPEIYKFGNKVDKLASLNICDVFFFVHRLHFSSNFLGYIFEYILAVFRCRNMSKIFKLSHD